ncbi:hypothetical protein G9A89_017288 [Geosiphon pyriformis]|nr:hypothetical protein G9A89_017288 [Geosiphon pyriformis]
MNRIQPRFTSGSLRNIFSLKQQQQQLFSRTLRPPHFKITSINRTLGVEATSKLASTSAKTSPPFIAMSQDVFSQLKEDHQIVRDLYQRYLKESSDEERQKIANTIIREVSVHSTTEEIVLYPAFEEALPDGKQFADHSRKEHLDIKKNLYDLDGMKVTDSGYKEKLGATMEEFDKHAKEEEEEKFPQFRKAVSEEKLQELGKKWINTRPLVPTRPHPSAPDKPPAETIAGATQAPIDRLRDAPREFVEVSRSV